MGVRSKSAQSAGLLVSALVAAGTAYFADGVWVIAITAWLAGIFAIVMGALMVKSVNLVLRFLE